MQSCSIKPNIYQANIPATHVDLNGGEKKQNFFSFLTEKNSIVMILITAREYLFNLFLKACF